MKISIFMCVIDDSSVNFYVKDWSVGAAKVLFFSIENLYKPKYTLKNLKTLANHHKTRLNQPLIAFKAYVIILKAFVTVASPNKHFLNMVNFNIDTTLPKHSQRFLYRNDFFSFVPKNSEAFRRSKPKL